jgi:hypothetical protein
MQIVSTHQQKGSSLEAVSERQMLPVFRERSY